MTADTSIVEAISKLSFGSALDPSEVEDLLGFADADVTHALGLQLRVLEARQARGSILGGWKIAFTSRGARDSVGRDVRPFGYVLAEDILPSGSRRSLSQLRGLVLEPEICVTIGTRLGGADVSVDEARAAVESVSAAFEICERRLPAGVPPSIRVVDRMSQWAIVVGEPVSPDVDLSSLTVSLRRDGDVLDTGTSVPATIDDPYLSLTRVCRELARFDLALEPGQRLITGSVLGGVEIEQAATWASDFGPLGAVSLTVAE